MEEGRDDRGRAIPKVSQRQPEGCEAAHGFVRVAHSGVAETMYGGRDRRVNSIADKQEEESGAVWNERVGRSGSKRAQTRQKSLRKLTKEDDRRQEREEIVTR